MEPASTWCCRSHHTCRCISKVGEDPSQIHGSKTPVGSLSLCHCMTQTLMSKLDIYVTTNCVLSCHAATVNAPENNHSHPRQEYMHACTIHTNRVVPTHRHVHKHPCDSLHPTNEHGVDNFNNSNVAQLKKGQW